MSEARKYTIKIFVKYIKKLEMQKYIYVENWKYVLIKYLYYN